PSDARAWVNRADIRRIQGDDAAGEKILQEGLDKAYDKAQLHHALGLLLIRQKRTQEAEAQFAEAAKARPEVPAYAMFLALAQDALGKTGQALDTIRLARLRHPNDRSLL